MFLKKIILISLFILLSVNILADELLIHGELKSQLELNLDEELLIEEANNVLKLELSHYNSNSGLFKGAFKYESNKNTVDLTELYSELYFANTDLIIGKQRISWGKGDGMNPTDYFNPEDLSDPFQGDNRINIPAVRVKRYYQDWEFDLVWTPIFRGNKLPQPGDRWYLEPDFKLPPGYSLIMKDLLEPERKLDNSQLGFRAVRWSADIDMSFSYYYGWRKDYTIYTSIDKSNSQIILEAKYNRLQGIGADFSKPCGKYVFRGETAYFKTVDEDIKEDYIQYVLGVDFNVVDNLYINTSFFGEKEKDQGSENGITLLLEYSLDDYSKLELNTIYMLKNEEMIINPVYQNDIMDSVSLSIGAYLLNGSDGGDIGQFTDKDYMYIEFAKVF